MKPNKLIEILSVAERLKDVTRHCFTSKGRRESVAEHSWRCALTAFLMTDEFPHADMSKVIKMCIIHDLGECFTGDIPTFDKTKEDELREAQCLNAWVDTFPEPYRTELRELYGEMAEQKTQEAKIYKAIDKFEAVIQHNESDISTWLPFEYDLNLTYGFDAAEFSPYMTNLRNEIKKDTLEIIKRNK